MLDKVTLVFDGDSEVSGVYSDYGKALEAMISTYCDYLKRNLDYYKAEDIIGEIIYDLETLQKGYIEEVCYCETHTVQGKEN